MLAVRFGERDGFWIAVEQCKHLPKSIYITLLYEECMPVLLEPLKTAVVHRKLKTECTASGTAGWGGWGQHCGTTNCPTLYHASRRNASLNPGGCPHSDLTHNAHTLTKPRGLSSQ